MSRATVAVALALGLLAPAPARAGDTWSDVAVTAEQEVARRAYDLAMLAGDDALDVAISQGTATGRRRYVDRAVLAYETAARAMPAAAEPHFRAASALHAFFVDCLDGQGASDLAALCRGPLSPQIAARLVGHWKAFETKAPLDPRVTDDILLDRAIFYTRQATPEALALARDDYRAILARRTIDQGSTVVLGNLAETEMMLGDLDASVTTYRRVLQVNQSTENYFGIAVALDRDEQGEEARALLRSLGRDSVRYLAERIDAQNGIFYVPEGEAYYYLALGFEANGMPDEAIRAYDLFIASGAHPRYAPRAQANRDALAARRKRAR